MPVRNVLPSLLRPLALVVLMAAGVAHADDYAEVNRLIKAGKTSEALARADQYLAGNARDPQMRFLKGVAQTRAGQTTEATATFTLLTEEYPELPEPYNNLAVIYAAQNELGKARVALEAAVRGNPAYAVAHENLGDIYVRLAHQSYSESLRRNANNTPLKLKLSTLRGVLEPAAAPKQP